MILDKLVHYHENELTLKGILKGKIPSWKRAIGHLCFGGFLIFNVCAAVFFLSHKIMYVIPCLISSIFCFVSAMFVSRLFVMVTIKKHDPPLYLGPMRINYDVLDERAAKKLKDFFVAHDLDGSMQIELQNALGERIQKQTKYSLAFSVICSAMFVALWGAYVAALFDGLKTKPIALTVLFILVSFITVIAAIGVVEFARMRDEVLTPVSKLTKLSDLFLEVRLTSKSEKKVGEVAPKSGTHSCTT